MKNKLPNFMLDNSKNKTKPVKPSAKLKANKAKAKPKTKGKY
jgi:hypothetical protein